MLLQHLNQIDSSTDLHLACENILASIISEVVSTLLEDVLDAGERDHYVPCVCLVKGEAQSFKDLLVH